MSRKNTKAVINMKALSSALLHLFRWAIGRVVFGHLWVINVHCVSPDHYASSENERFNKVQMKYKYMFVCSK